MTDIQLIKGLLSSCNEEQRRELFRLLRIEFPIHPLEQKLNAPAEIIMEAIDRSSDLTLRGVRGVIAEAAFEVNVLKAYHSWNSRTLPRDSPYDFLIEDTTGGIRIQVKMQRLKNHRPMMANEGYRFLPSTMYVVETQRTRGGIDPRTGESTRPYRFAEFDILAVSLHPSTNDWTAFRYTVADWLVPQRDDKRLMLKFQPVPMMPDNNWTDDLTLCIDWKRTGVKKCIWDYPPE